MVRIFVNELVSNAPKYAFNIKKSGSIHITIEPKNAIEYELRVNDSGKGLPENFETDSVTSLGLKLVMILSRQFRSGFIAKKDAMQAF